MVNPTNERSKRRRGAREVGESSTQGPVAGSTRFNYYRDEDARKDYENRYVDRRILNGRPINVECLSEFPIVEWFNTQGWTRLLSNEYFVYPNLVRMFYANLKVYIVNGKDELDCFVKGVQFRLTERVIEEVLGVQSSASRPRRPINPTMAKIEILGEHAGAVANHASYLDIPTRLLMLVVDWSVRPTSGHYTRLTEVTAMIMHNVKFGNYANLGRIMVSHMANIVNHMTANLPYGMWLTPIFEHFGIDLSYEIKNGIPASSYIGERTLASMGYERVSFRGPWRRKQVRRDEPERGESDEERQGEEPQEEDEPPQEVRPTFMRGSSSSSSSYLPYMARFDALEEQARASREAQDSFYAEMRETQNNFYNEIRESQHSFYSAVDSRLASLDDNMAGMNQFIQSYMAHHPEEFPPPPPPTED